MFHIDSQAKRIRPLQVKSFSELGFSERNDLQEWLANQPSALGEELLIIQKEFDGFDETRERLDLLAIDKDGCLVVIENKLDDSGRDVVWQSLKYASYFATSTKQDILNIYQKYLDKFEKGKDASQSVCEFLDVADIDELRLNSGNTQRIILVAANFRKEVTSTVLWLLEKGVDITCVKVTPYAMGEELLLNVEQIVPTPESKELMIGLSAKEAEEKTTEITQKKRHRLRRNFWDAALEQFRQSQCTLFNNISPSDDHWLSAGSGISSCYYNLIFSHKEVRVEWIISRRNQAENKSIFDLIHQHRVEIENQFEAELNWRRMDDKVSSRINFAWAVDGYNADNWEEMIKWLIEHISRLEQAMSPLLPKISNLIKNNL